MLFKLNFNMLKNVMVAAALSIAVPATALPSAIGAPQAVGQERFSFVGVPIYDAKLFTEGGKAYSASQPYILELTYLRSITNQQLVTATKKELSRIGYNANQDQALSNCFRDVNKGDRFAAVSKAPGSVDIYYNDQKTCTMSGGLASNFVALFLSDNARDLAGSRRLRGQ